MATLDPRYLSHLAAGGTLLTSSRRQSRAIRRLFDESQVAAGQRCWPTADVLPVDAWLSARWEDLCERDAALPLLLSDTEALWPWRLTATAFLDDSLVGNADLAAAARRAWLLLQRHGGSLEDLDGESLTRDQRQFRHWAAAVETQLADRGWLDPGRLEAALAERADRLAPVPPLLLAGFDRPTPALQDLFGRLGEVGARVEWAPPDGDRTTPSCLAASDGADEDRAWLGWLRHRLQRNPGARLAVVLPDLPSRRAAVERALDAFLQPELEQPGRREHDRVHDLAGGEPLASWSVAAVALDLLDCLAPSVELATFSRLLRSRYVPAGDDWDPRCRLDVSLRREGVATWSATSLAVAARHRGCPGVGAALESARRLAREGPAHRPADAWAAVFGSALAGWGWPGAETLSSDEYQAAEAVKNRLADLARLARVTPELTCAEARLELARALQAPFQPERGAPSVWILDALEPTGLSLDGLWVAGMTATAWPVPARHDPFLPLALQRRLGMPGVTAEDALVEARRTVDDWCHGAAEVVFSWPRRVDDAEMEPSRLLPPGAPAFAASGAGEAGDVHAVALQRAGRCEPVKMDPAPVLVGAGRGGSRILDLQAKCPFRAFAELRLRARPLEEPATGVEPRLRGTVLHATLEGVWRELGHQAALASLEPRDLESLVERCLDAALREHLPAPLGARAHQLEHDWQRAAALQALSLDRQRGPFEVVATEEDVEAELAGLTLRCRVDRVDRIDGGLLVIDYKTGRAATSQWRGTRPDAPQLPLYATLKGDTVGGTAFLVVDAQGARVRGVARDEQRLDGMDVPERFPLTDDREKGFTWPEIRAHWSAWLARLAREHREGHADVDPKQPQTCRYCHLGTLCRVSPALDTAEDGEGDDG